MTKKHHFNSKIFRLAQWLKIIPLNWEGWSFLGHAFYFEKEPPEWLVIHEEQHILQYHRHGLIGSVRIWWQDRNKPYWEKRFEKEAYEISDPIKRGLIKLIHRT